MLEFKLERHRCFNIPREKLDLFLVALHVNFSIEGVKHQMAYVFLSEDKTSYDVVVSQYGTYGYVERAIERFVEALK